MTRWLQAAISAQRTTDETDKTDETPSPQGFQARNPQQAEVSSVVSVLSVGRKRDETTALAHDASHAPPSAPGRMVTAWTGERVSADAHANMTDLERYGPRGVLFCGKCWQPRRRDTALGCLEGRSCR